MQERLSVKNIGRQKLEAFQEDSKKSSNNKRNSLINNNEIIEGFL